LLDEELELLVELESLEELEALEELEESLFVDTVLSDDVFFDGAVSLEDLSVASLLFDDSLEESDEESDDDSSDFFLSLSRKSVTYQPLPFK
jgi:hypothetical protein